MTTLKWKISLAADDSVSVEINWKPNDAYIQHAVTQSIYIHI